MDDFTKEHFEAWLDYTVGESLYNEVERTNTKTLIMNLVEEYPELLLTHSWPEIRSLAERTL